MSSEILMLCVGKAGRRPEAELVRGYLDRLPAKVRLIEVEERRPLSPKERRRREGEKLRAALPPGAFLVALDERGRQMTSTAFAESLAAWQAAAPCLAFAVGGAEGLDPAFLEQADVRLALSTMTWPHMLVRVMLAEQLFRAYAIRSGHPYHRRDGGS